MALTILLLLLFTVLLLAYGWRNRYFLYFALLVLAAALSMLSLTVEIAKVSNYLVPANYLIRPLETRLYALFHFGFALPLSTLLLLRNVGIAVYFGGIVCFVQSFSSSIRLDSTVSSRRRLSLRYVPLIGFPALFFVFYHPQTAFFLFHLYHGGRMPHLDRVIGILDAAMTAGVLLYLLWPVLFLLINYRKGRMTLLSGYLLRLAVALFVLNTSFFIMFFTGVFRVSCDDVLRYGFWRFSLPTQIPVFYSSVLPFFTFAVIAAVFLMLMHLHDDHLFNFIKFHGIRKNLNALYANVRNVMHSEKNLLFTIRILAQDALDSDPDGPQAEKLQKILNLCSRNMDDLTRTLYDAHDMNVNTMRNDFVSAVETAIADLRIPENIRIERNYSCETLPLFFDMYHMVHAISNVLSNSLDALSGVEREEPTISLDLYASRNWVYFSVWDNGCGIPARILHKVDRPYVSTKNKKNSWGIGLSYVYSVIRAHYGQMRIRSREGEYTRVEILLSRTRRRRKKP
ncbi:MAG: HAMP domain-containing histidine kinase [Clostridiales bacterium]|nr:HAMP domain-containing histidine kinase [Clostridiales bacterium]